MKFTFVSSGILAILLAVFCSAAPACAARATAGQNTPAPSVGRRIGVIKAVSGNNITLAPESGSEIMAVVAPNARLLRLNPGEKDLKNATPIQLQDLQVGDTIRVRGFASEDGKSINTLEVLVITHSVVAAVSDQIRQDWQKRGIGGLVSAVDPGSGTVTISVTGFGSKKSVAIHTSKSTLFRRYAPDSVKFEDAKPSSLAEVHPGDQLRARGNRSADGTEFTAEEIVSGSFRNIAGTVNSLNASSGILTVQDLLSKKPVQVKIAADSQLHQLPAEMAQRIAARLKAAMSGARPAATPGAAGPSTSAKPAAANGEGAPERSGPRNGGMHAGGAPDFQQLLNRMPAVKLGDLHRGDAVLIVTTPGSATNPSTAITLLSGVEPILEAAPNASQAMMLTPWSLGGAPGGDAGNQ